MFSFSSPRRRSPTTRRRLALVLATAENLIVEMNVAEAIRFLEATEQKLPFDNALEIYFRLVGVPQRIRHAITVLTLSRISEGSEAHELIDAAPAGKTGGLRSLARRLQGRRDEALRKRVEEATARARAELRSSYIDGATLAVDSLREIMPPNEAVRCLIESMQVGEGWAELLYHEVAGREWAEPPGESEEEKNAPEEEVALEEDVMIEGEIVLEDGEILPDENSGH